MHILMNNTYESIEILMLCNTPNDPTTSYILQLLIVNRGQFF